MPFCRLASINPSVVPTIPTINASSTSDAAVTCARFLRTDFLNRYAAQPEDPSLRLPNPLRLLTQAQSE